MELDLIMEDLNEASDNISFLQLSLQEAILTKNVEAMENVYKQLYAAVLLVKELVPMIEGRAILN